MLLAITIWIITVVTTVLFASRVWWFPESASSHGDTIDRQFVITMAVTGVVFVISQFALGWFILKYKEKTGQKAHYSHGSNKMEITWTGATLVMFFLMVIPGLGVWNDVFIKAAASDSVQIEVTAQQFAWNIRYPGSDGQFGNTRVDLISDSSGNPLGLDPEDPAAEDDLVVPTMAIPINRPIELLLRSKDVTHNFSVRELRLKQDTVPGLVLPLRFTATKLGRYELACSELCGLGHHRMRSFVEVLSDGDYARWLAEQAEF